MKKSPTQIISFRVPNKEYWALVRLGHSIGLDIGPLTRALMRHTIKYSGFGPEFAAVELIKLNRLFGPSHLNNAKKKA